MRICTACSVCTWKDALAAASANGDLAFLDGIMGAPLLTRALYNVWCHTRRYGKALQALPAGGASLPLRQALLGNRCLARCRAGRRAEGLADADALLALQPGSAKAHYRRGQCLLGAGRCALHVGALVTLPAPCQT